jgi:hypothetical protein
MTVRCTAVRAPADRTRAAYHMPYFYSGFGLTLESDCAIPGMVPVDRPSSIDTHIWLVGDFPGESVRGRAEAPWYVSEREDGDAPALHAWRLKRGDYFRLLYLDGSDFVIDRAGANVWGRWPSCSTLADTATYLLGPVLGLVLRLRSVTCLHGSAVSFRDSAIALVGAQGAGKSTTAAAFSRRRHSVLADDVLPLFARAGSWCVHPTYPQLRLWPDSAAALCGSPDALPPLTPTWDKRALDLTSPESRFEPRPLPLAAVYLLEGPSTNAAPVIEEVSGRTGLMALLGNTYVSYLLESQMRAREFEDLAALIAHVPLRRVRYVRNFSGVHALCDAILADCERLACTA